jgi:hypothetical protein
MGTTFSVAHRISNSAMALKFVQALAKVFD